MAFPTKIFPNQNVIPNTVVEDSLTLSELNSINSLAGYSESTVETEL